MSRALQERGFTLVELIVAVALTGLAMALVAGSLWSAVEVRARQAETAEAEHRARVTREFLREAVRGLAVEREGRGELIVLRPEPAAGGVPSGRLVLSTRGGAIFGWDAGLKAVELVVDRDPATPQAGLVARVFRLVPGGAVEDTLSLLPHATALQVRLRDDDGSWREEWPDASRAPTAVEFHFGSDSLAAGDPLLPLPLRVRVP